ncbi:MAG: LytR/AlgR family response regulator transcription factor [Gammaproteobacteria bacterium]|jgi:two-component system response regulator AlgR
MKVLIVDDELLARERLHDLTVELYPDVITLEASNGMEALEKINKHHPDIVLLDIRMPGMDGLEVANHILQLEEKKPAIVFTTAYQDHAISAFDANAVDYLLKPIRKERLNTAIERAAVVSQTQLTSIHKEEKNASARTHLSAMVQGDLQLVPIENIYFFKADQKYVSAVWQGGELLLDESLASLEAEFSKDFMRIHRNALVAINHVDSLSKTSDGQHVIKISDMSVELAISRRHLSEVKKVLKSH